MIDNDFHLEIYVTIQDVAKTSLKCKKYKMDLYPELLTDRGQEPLVNKV